MESARSCATRNEVGSGKACFVLTLPLHGHVSPEQVMCVCKQKVGLDHYSLELLHYSVLKG